MAYLREKVKVYESLYLVEKQVEVEQLYRPTESVRQKIIRMDSPDKTAQLGTLGKLLLIKQQIQNL